MTSDPQAAPLDGALLEGRRRRWWPKGAPTFLADALAADLIERLSLVQRRFDAWADLSADDGILRGLIAASGQAGALVAATADAVRPLGAGEAVGLQAGSVDLVASSLLLHFTNDTPGVLAQINRALRPDGLLLAALLGGETLTELRQSLLLAETELAGGASPRVLPFADLRDAGALLQRTGFALPVVDLDRLTVRYDTAFELMADLRAMGAANPLSARSRRPATRALFLRTAQIYAERFADPDGRIRATFDVIYLSGWKPHESQQKPLKPGSAKASLKDALRGA